MSFSNPSILVYGLTFQRKLCVYENPETSEVASEHITLASAMAHPPKVGAEIICNGHILATVENGEWKVTEDGKDWTKFI